MKSLLTLTLLLSFSTKTFASIDDFEITDDINEISPVKIREIKELLRTMPKDETCMDEFLKRRNQLIVKLIASPAMISATIIGGAYVGAGSALLVMKVIPSTGSNSWVALGNLILGGIGGGVFGTAYGIVNTTKAGMELNQVNTTLKTLGEYYLNREGVKTEKMYSKFMLQNSETNITKDDYVDALIELDQKGTICDGSLVAQPRIRLGSKLKYKVAKTNSINKTIARSLILD